MFMRLTEQKLDKLCTSIPLFFFYLDRPPPSSVISFSITILFYYHSTSCILTPFIYLHHPLVSPPIIYPTFSSLPSKLLTIYITIFSIVITSILSASSSKLLYHHNHHYITIIVLISQTSIHPLPHPPTPHHHHHHPPAPSSSSSSLQHLLGFTPWLSSLVRIRQYVVDFGSSFT